MDALPRVTLRSLTRGVLANLPRTPGQLRAVPAGLRADPDSTERTIGAMVARNAERFGHRPAVLFEDERWSWRRLDRAANRAAHLLGGQGVGEGCVVPVVSGNRPELLVAVVALARLGAVAALVNPELPEEGLRRQLGADWAIVERRFVDLCGEGAVFVPCRGRELPPPRCHDLRAPHQLPTPPKVHVRAGQPALHVFTSGTTGLPKASVMTHLRWARAGAVTGRILLGLRRDDVVYCPLPFFHNLALTACFGGVVASGACLALAPRFSARGYWDDVRRFGATCLPYIGELPRYLLAQPPSPRDRDHRVRAAFGVGMPRPIWAEFQERFGVDFVYEIYAASESNTLFLNLFNQRGTVGFCPSWHRLVAFDVEAGDIVLEGGRPRRPRRGEPGLLLGGVTPRFGFDGYTDEAATERKLRRDLFRRGDAWLDSGDLLVGVGWMHAAFVDRVGQTFRWKSENVSTLQVEGVLDGVPGVVRSAVYGVQVPGMPGKAGMAALEVDQGVVFEVLLAAVARALERALPEPARPLFVRRVDGLETTGTWKIRKVDLTREGWGGEGVWMRRAGGFVVLDEGLRGELEAGRLRL